MKLNIITKRKEHRTHPHPISDEYLLLAQIIILVCEQKEEIGNTKNRIIQFT